jgi:hypothetical protein
MVKKIKPGEKFQLHDQVFEYTVSDKGGILMKSISQRKAQKSHYSLYSPFSR